MRDKSIGVFISALVMGVFGAFFRWLQRTNAFEPETGLFRSGAGVHYLMALCILAGATAFALLVARLWVGAYLPKTPDLALKPRTRLTHYVVTGAALATLAAGVFMLFTMGSPRHLNIERAYAASVAGAGICMLFSTGSLSAPGAGRVTLPLLTLCMCVWLTRWYWVEAENPVIWSCCLEILALIFDVLAWYGLGGWYFDRASPGKTLFYLLMAVFLDCTVLADPLGRITKILFLAQIAALMSFCVILLGNIRENPQQ